MKQLKQKLFITFFILSAFICTDSQTTEMQTLTKNVNQYVNTIMNRHKIPGAAVAIVQDGKVTHKKYYGKASLVHNVPVTEKTIFRIYSTTKLFVATGLFKLIEENKLSLEDDVTKYVVGLPVTWHPLKVKHLITHSSGLPDMSPFWKFQNLNEAQAKAVVFKEKLKSKPGEEYNYNQTNFWLLQQIIEKASGQKFEDFILKHQFSVSNKNAFFNVDSRDIIPNRTLPYFPFSKNRIQIDTSFSGEYLSSANGFNITLDEFIKWNKKFDKDEFIKRKTRDLMWTPFTYKKPSKFAYSWGIYPLNNRTSYGFTGGLVTGFRKVPKDKLTIIFLTNGFDQYFQVDDVIDYLAGIVDKDLYNKKLITIEKIQSEFIEGDVINALANYQKWKSEIPNVNFEDFLNTQGYANARRGNIKIAIEIFKLNAREYPDSGNVWDSLGEGYEMAGDYKKAILNYKKSLAIDKSNQHAIDKLKLLNTRIK